MIRFACKEYIDLPTRNGHACTLCRFHGHTYLAWFGGTVEGAGDVDIYMTRRGEHGWLPPVRICADEKLAHWNPVMLAQEDHIDLFFKVGPSVPQWHTMRIAVGENLELLSQPEELIPGDTGGRGPVKNKCLRLSSGRLLAPASLEEGVWRSYVDISEDNGKTFSRLSPIPLYRKGDSRPDNPDRDYCFAAGPGAIQPTLWQTPDGAVHALMRSSEGYILRTDSFDEGETWCPAYRTPLPNNNSGIDLVRMDSGAVVLALNPVSGNWGARFPLCLYVSLDEGETFQPLMTLEARSGEYSYPSIIAEGTQLWVAYTWNRTKMALYTLKIEA